MPYEREELLKGLRAAHAAGDIAATNELAAALDKLPLEATVENMVGALTAAAPTAAEQRQAEFDQEPFYGQLAAGVQQNLTELGHGAADLVGAGDLVGITPQDRQDLNELRQLESGWKTAGDIGTDIASLIVPGGAIARGANVVRQGLPRAAAILAGESALGAGHAALKAPTEGTSRAQAAGLAAVGGAVGGAAGMGLARAMGRVGQGMARTPAAQAMLDADIPLTPGMVAGPGSMASRVESFMGEIPIAGRSVGSLQREAQEAWNKKILDQVSPLGQVDDIGQAGIGKIQKQFDDLYKGLQAQITPESYNIGRGLSAAESGANLARKLPKAAGRKARKVMGDIKSRIKLFEATGDATLLEGLDDTLRALGKGKDKQIKNFYRNVRDDLRKAMPEDVGAQLKQLDGKYRDFATVQRASAYKKAADQGGVFSPDNLMGSVKARNSERLFSRGDAPLQKEAAEAAATISNLVPGAKGSLEGRLITPATAVAAYADPVSTSLGIGGVKAAATEPMRKVLTGALEQPLGKAADAIGSSALPSAVGASLSNRQREDEELTRRLNLIMRMP